MSEDDLVRRLQVGHDSGCAMSYGMHEHCCDCSYPYRQESAETILKLRQDLAAARADATLLRSTLIDIAAVMGMSSLPSYSEWEKIRNKALQLVAALAGEKRNGL